MSDEELSADALKQMHQDRLKRARRPVVDPTCETCRWWHDGKMSGTYCRRHAPKFFAGEGYSFTAWPQTNAEDWCGEHQPRDTGNDARPDDK